MASSGLWIVQILYLRPIPELRLLIKSFLNLNKVCSSQSDKCRLLNRCPEMSISKEASWGRQRLVYRGQTLFYSKNVWGHFQNLHEKICLHWPLVTSIFSQFWPQKHAHENRGVKRASHVKFELNLWCGTPSNRLLNNKTASNWPQKQPQSYVWGHFQNLHEKI